jgi:hypothetical protein
VALRCLRGGRSCWPCPRAGIPRILSSWGLTPEHVPALFLADAAHIELPGAAVSAEDYQGILLYAGDDAPLDGIGELLVALHDIRQILSRPALARLAKIERVAEEVASAAPPAPGPGPRSERHGAGRPPGSS